MISVIIIANDIYVITCQLCMKYKQFCVYPAWACVGILLLNGDHWQNHLFLHNFHTTKNCHKTIKFTNVYVAAIILYAMHYS